MTDKFQATLPFDAIWTPKQARKSKKNRAKAIKRTKTRWSWFTRAEKLDKERRTGLGTLGYLPCEIREKILIYVLDQHMDYSEADMCNFMTELSRGGCQRILFEKETLLEQRYLRYGHVNMSNWDPLPSGNVVLDPKWTYLPRPYNKQLGIRAATWSLQDEFDAIVLRNFTLRFDPPEVCQGLLNSLRPPQISYLRRIEIGLQRTNRDGCVSPTTVNAWTAMFTQLPTTLNHLRSVRLSMFGAHIGSWRSDACNSCMWSGDY